MAQHSLIAPILALVLWTLVIWLWMYATRIPAMQKAKIDPQAAARTRTLSLAPEVMWVSDNYNHLMEQPTIFYAAAFAAQTTGHADAVNVGLARPALARSMHGERGHAAVHRVHAVDDRARRVGAANGGGAVLSPRAGGLRRT
jgi:hypothetical protein